MSAKQSRIKAFGFLVYLRFLLKISANKSVETISRIRIICMFNSGTWGVKDGSGVGVRAFNGEGVGV